MKRSIPIAKESHSMEKGGYPGKSEVAWDKCMAEYGKESDIKQTNSCEIKTYNGDEYHSPMQRRK